jgi:hypothetical protein
MNSGSAMMAHGMACLHQELMKMVLLLLLVRHRRMKMASHNLPRRKALMMMTST